MKKIKNLIRGLILGVSALIIVGCATQTLPPGGQTTESVITACSTYATVLIQLTAIKPQLSASDVGTINKSVTLTEPICGNPNSYNSSGAISALMTETTTLKSILAKP